MRGGGGLLFFVRGRIWVVSLFLELLLVWRVGLVPVPVLEVLLVSMPVPLFLVIVVPGLWSGLVLVLVLLWLRNLKQRRVSMGVTCANDLRPLLQKAGFVVS